MEKNRMKSKGIHTTQVSIALKSKVAKATVLYCSLNDMWSTHKGHNFVIVICFR